MHMIKLMLAYFFSTLYIQTPLNHNSGHVASASSQQALDGVPSLQGSHT
jgi:hypothetical protein